MLSKEIRKRIVKIVSLSIMATGILWVVLGIGIAAIYALIQYSKDFNLPFSVFATFLLGLVVVTWNELEDRQRKV